MNLSDFVAEENADQKMEIEEAVERLGHIDRARFVPLGRGVHAGGDWADVRV